MTHVESSALDPLMQGELPIAGASMSPEARLLASRAALQQWITHTYHPERLEPGPEELHGPARPYKARRDPLWLSALVDSLSDVPAGAVAARYLRRWWRRHPLRATAELGGELGRELIGPTATRHPWLVLGGAVVAGALLGRLRPWTWIPGTAILSSLVPPISLASLLGSVTALFSATPADDLPQSTEPMAAAEPPAARSAATSPDVEIPAPIAEKQAQAQASEPA